MTEKPAPDKATDKTKGSEHRENERALVRWTRAVAFLTGGLIFVGAVTGYIFYKQLSVMQGQLDAIEREQRPYLWTINDLGQPQLFRGAGREIGQIIWGWTYTNLGKTAAYDVRFDQFIKIGGLYKRNYGPKGPSYGGEVPPGVIRNSTGISEPVIEEAEFKRLLGIERSIGLLIVLGYADGAGRRYEAVICMERLISGAIALPDPTTCKKEP